jgi:hypothetical protein
LRDPGGPAGAAAPGPERGGVSGAERRPAEHARDRPGRHLVHRSALGPDQGPDTPGSELFGPTNFDNELWSLNLDSFRWTQLHPQGPAPNPRDNVAAFFDAVHGGLVLFGGQYFDRVTNGITNEFGDGELLDDLWKLTWPKD